MKYNIWKTGSFAAFLCAILLLIGCGSGTPSSANGSDSSASATQAEQTQTVQVHAQDEATQLLAYPDTAILVFDNTGTSDQVLTPMDDASADATADRSSNLLVNDTAAFHTMQDTWRPASFICTDTQIAYIKPIRYEADITSITIKDVQFTSASGDATASSYTLHTAISLTADDGSELACDSILLSDEGDYSFTVEITTPEGPEEITYQVQVTSDSFSSDLVASALPDNLIINPRSDRIRSNLELIHDALMTIAARNTSSDAQILSDSFFLTQLNKLMTASGLSMISSQELASAASSPGSGSGGSSQYNYYNSYYYSLNTSAESGEDAGSDGTGTDTGADNNSTNSSTGTGGNSSASGGNQSTTPADNTGGTSTDNNPSDNNGGSSTDTGGGSSDTGGGSTDTGGGSSDTGGGSSDTGGSTPVTPVTPDPTPTDPVVSE